MLTFVYRQEKIFETLLLLHALHLQAGVERQLLTAVKFYTALPKCWMGRKAQFIEELVLQGLTPKGAETEVLQSIDRLVYYAGWCDKYSALFSSVNPVASSHFNFSVPEPTGVVSVIAPEDSGLAWIGKRYFTNYLWWQYLRCFSL